MPSCTTVSLKVMNNKSKKDRVKTVFFYAKNMQKYVNFFCKYLTIQQKKNIIEKY